MHTYTLQKLKQQHQTVINTFLQISNFNNSLAKITPTVMRDAKQKQKSLVNNENTFDKNTR